LCTDIAARTSRIRLGQAANIVTFWNPLRFVEDIAVLDHMSNGRVEVGIGRGVYGREASNLNKDADLKDQAKNFRLFAETVELMKKAWTQDFISHQGEFFTYSEPGLIWSHPDSPKSETFMNMETNEIEKISILPKPLQKPHPQLWQVVDSTSSIEWAAKNDINVIMWIPTVKTLKKRFEIYRDARSEKLGREVPLGEGISLVRDMFCAENMEDAQRLGGDGILKYLKWICHWRGLGNHLDPGEELPDTQGKLDALTYEWLHPRNMLFGTPEYIVEKIKELQSELNLQSLMLWSHFPDVPHETAMRSIKLFNEEVLPHFKSGTVTLAN
jgi:alkanesulfonate monooxygenase SsuD/methylene tetrahydromethanopterin reductase-like flavin-dependent oxidoreductase (luciferase family)